MIHERTATLTQADGRRWVISTREECPDPLAWVLKDIDGWIGDGVGVKAFVTDRLDHGNFPMRGYREGRTLTLTGAVLATDQAAADQAEREIANIMWSGEYGTLRVEESDSLTLSAQVRLDGTPQIDRVDLRRIKFSIPLASADSFLYADPRTSYGYPLGTGLGLVYPWFTGYYEPTVIPDFEPYITMSRSFNDLTDLPGTGLITPNGNATLSVSNAWASDGDTSLMIGPGTSASSAYVLPRNSPLDKWAGRLVTVEGDIWLQSAQSDNPPASPYDPPRGIHVGADKLNGSGEWGYAHSNSAPNTAGVHTVRTSFLVPTNEDYYSGWFIRLFNGSTTTPVWWDRLSVSGLWVPLAQSRKSLNLSIPRTSGMSAFDMDPGSAEAYVGQARGADEPNRVNLARNAGFTSMLGQFGVSTIQGSSTTLSLSHDWYSEGQCSLKVVSTSDSGSVLLMPHTGSGRLGKSLEGKQLTASVDMYLPQAFAKDSGGLARTIGIGYVDSAGNASTPSSNWSAPVPNVAGAHRIHVSAQIPDGALAVYVYVKVNGVGTVYLDRFTLEEGVTDGTYVPPSLIRQNPLERVNLLDNGSFENGVQQLGLTPKHSGNTATVETDTAWALHGSKSLKITPVSTGNGDSGSYVLGTDVEAIKAAGLFEPGETYTVSATLRLTAAQTGNEWYHARGIRVSYWDGSSTSYGWGYSAGAPNVAGTHRVSYTFTVPPEATGSKGVFITLSNGTPSGSVWWDGFVVERGWTDGSWFTSQNTRAPMAKLSRTPVNLLDNQDTNSLRDHSGKGDALAAGGGASVSVSTDAVGASTPRTIKISAGSSYSSTVYGFNKSMPVDSLGGYLAHLSVKYHMTQVQSDNPEGTTTTPPRSLTLVGIQGPWDDYETEFGVLQSNKAPNAVGTHDLSLTFVVPNSDTPYEAWNFRVMNGSTAVPVYYSEPKLIAEKMGRPTPGKVVSLDIRKERALQGIDVDPATGDYYVTQRHLNGTTAYVHHLSPEGVLLSTMEVPDAGHAGDIAIERYDGAIWWWCYWPGRKRRCRIRYRAGLIDPSTLDGVEELPGPHGYIRYSINSADGIVVERTNTVGTDGRERPLYEMFNLDDYRAGTKTLLKSIQSTYDPLPSYQGFVVDKDYIYEASGGTRQDPTALFRYDWNTFTRKGVLTSGWGEDAGGYGEAEGVCFGTDGYLRVGKATGESGARTARVIALDQTTAFDFEAGYVVPGAVSSTVGANTDGYVRRLDERGAELDSMLLLRVGELREIAAERDSDGVLWVWVQWDELPGKAARVRYRPGLVEPRDADVEPIDVGAVDSVDFAIRGEEVAVHSVVGEVHTYAVYALEAYRAGERTPTRGPLTLERSNHAWHGFTFDETHIYVHRGGDKGDPASLWQYLWEDGSGKVLRTDALGQADDVKQVTAAGVAHLPDGETLVLGTVSGGARQRASSLHEVTVGEQFDYEEAWAESEETEIEESTEGGVLTYGDALEQPEAVLENRGLADAYATAMVVGDFPGGVTLTTGLTGESLTYPWALVESSPLVIYGDGTAQVAGTDVTHMLSDRGFQLLQVAPGETLTLYLEALQGGTGYLQLAIQDTYA